MDREMIFLWFWVVGFCSIFSFYVSLWVYRKVKEWLEKKERERKREERRRKAKVRRKKKREHLKRAKRHDDQESSESVTESYSREVEKKSVRGKIMNRLGISYEKPEREETEDKEGGEARDLDQKGRGIKEKRLRKKWDWVISELEKSGEVKVGKNQHYGGLRGNDIILRAYSELKRLGYDNLEKELGENKSYLRVNN